MLDYNLFRVVRILFHNNFLYQNLRGFYNEKVKNDGVKRALLKKVATSIWIIAGKEICAKEQ